MWAKFSFLSFPLFFTVFPAVFTKGTGGGLIMAESSVVGIGGTRTSANTTDWLAAEFCFIITPP